MVRKYHDLTALPRTRDEAKQLGVKAFFTGEPCALGHVTLRSTINGQCRGCSDERKRAWVLANPEREKANARAYYEANKADFVARATARRKANPAADRESARRNRPKHRERLREWARKDRAANPEKHRVKVRNRRARMRSLPGKHTPEDITQIAAAQRHRCAYCPRKITPKTWEVDHIQPVAREGANDRRNLQLLCLPCNRAKSAKDPITFAQEKGLLL